MRALGFRLVIGVLVLSTLPLVADDERLTSQPDETLPGFRAERVYELHDFESVNPFNGAVNPSFPIGPAYPLSAAYTFQLVAHYNSKFWRINRVSCQFSDVEACGQ